MRYLSWDVLLFPADSRVPLQEFDTKCHVLPDQNNRLIDNAALNSNPYLSEIETMSQIPVLNTFVSSLEQGSPFRVSVHSWEQPKPSQILRTFKTHEEFVAYEARVYIDGIMVTQKIFNEMTVWPEVIESTGDTDPSHSKVLRFPVFHSEILDQAHWEPDEAYGRIRVVVAEGVTRQNNGARMLSAFDRLRDIVAFSFQHAPRNILEYSGIAWPNARLFRRGKKLVLNTVPERIGTFPDSDAHAHSPQRSQAGNTSATLVGSTATPSSISEKCKEISDIEDPFVDPLPISLRGKQFHLRKSSTEVSTKEYNSIRTVRSHTGTDMSGLSYQKPDFERAINEAAVDEIIRALSPERKHDLIQALSPQKDTVCSLNVGNFRHNDRQEGHMNTAFAISCDLKSDNHSGGLRGNLLASRYASVPLLTPSTAVSRQQGSSYGLRNAIDPLLPTGWRQFSHVAEDNLGPVKALLELRPRSTSNSSKRKRQDSPSMQTPKEPTQSLGMSTSPCKSKSVTPLYVNIESLNEGGVALDKQGSSG